MWLDKLQSPPAPGSIQDLVAKYLWLRRQDIEYYRTFALMMASFLTPDSKESTAKVQEAWTDYTQAVYPYLGDLKEALLEKVKDELEKMSTKPLVVTPMVPGGSR